MSCFFLWKRDESCLFDMLVTLGIEKKSTNDLRFSFHFKHDRLRKFEQK